MTYDKNQLINMACKASQNAYAPYSNFRVGSAVLAASGKIYVGVNVENSAFGSTICAERVAISAAIAAGEREFLAIAIYNSDSLPNPCGACLQVLAELAPSAQIIVVSDADTREYTLDQLLPKAFMEVERLKKRRI